MNRVFVVIPAFNEASVIKDVIGGVRDAGYHRIIVVDDGSGDNTFAKASSIPGTIVLRHKINRGKGAATITGMCAAILSGAEIIVTMDGDGQHDPKDINRLVEPLLTKSCDLVLGSRLMAPEGMPTIKIIANKIGNLFTFLLYGVMVNDSQSGFRAYSRFAAELIDTRADRYEFDSKVIREISRNKLAYKELEIAVRYTDYSMSKPQKQGFINGLKTLGRMIWDIFV